MVELLRVRNVLYAVLEDYSTLSSPLFASEGPVGRHTPALERLSARGTVFRRAFCQAPICNPSRSSFLTGRRPSATRVYSNEDLAPPPLPTIVDFIRRSPAAAVVCTGKIFHIACDKETRGFTNGGALLRADASMAALADAHLSNVSRHSAAVRATLGNAHRLSGQRTNDQDKARIALRLLAFYAHMRQRFFLAVGLSSTHVQGSRICTPAAAAAAQEETGPPSVTNRDLAPPRAHEVDPPLLTWPNWDLQPLGRTDIGYRWQREAVGEYHACAAHVDAQIGALLDALDALQLTASTAVVVQGDHGFSLGRHGRWSKYNLYEDATRVPLIIALPGGAPKVVDDVVEALDVMPTILDLWGVRRRDGGQTSTFPAWYELGGAAVPLEGQSLTPYLHTLASRDGHDTRDEHPPRRAPYARSELREQMLVHRPADSQLPGARPMRQIGRGAQLLVRDRHFSYVAFVRPRCGCASSPWSGLLLLDEQLFDVLADPHETVNLAYSAAHRSTRDAMLAIVVRDWGIDLDVGSTKSDRAARAARIERLAACYNRSSRCATALGLL
jgi:hypothetical protein